MTDKEIIDIITRERDRAKARTVALEAKLLEVRTRLDDFVQSLEAVLED